MLFPWLWQGKHFDRGSAWAVRKEQFATKLLMCLFVPKAVESAFRRIYPAEAHLKATSAYNTKDSLTGVRLGEAVPHAGQGETR